MNNNKSVQWLTRTAMLLATALLVQLLRFVIPGDSIITTYIISSLINAVLVVAAASVNPWSGLVVALATPLVAFFQGHLPNPVMIPFVAVGNAFVALSGGFAIPRLKARWWALPKGVVLKYAATVLGTAIVLSTKKGAPISAVAGTALAQQFVQLPTAVIGMVIAYPVFRALKWNKKTK